MRNAHYYIEKLNLSPHPEGGFFKEAYRDSLKYPPHKSFKGERNYSTSIYYLLEKDDFSSFHRIKSDEVWHHYDGGCLLVHYFEKNKLITKKLGKKLEEGELPQIVVPKNVWFAAEPNAECDFALLGCTVAPGFDFQDFEMANKEDLTKYFREYGPIINRLVKQN